MYRPHRPMRTDALSSLPLEPSHAVPHPPNSQPLTMGFTWTEVTGLGKELPTPAETLLQPNTSNSSITRRVLWFPKLKNSMSFPLPTSSEHWSRRWANQKLGRRVKLKVTGKRERAKLILRVVVCFYIRLTLSQAHVALLLLI